MKMPNTLKVFISEMRSTLNEGGSTFASLERHNIETSDLKEANYDDIAKGKENMRKDIDSLFSDYRKSYNEYKALYKID